MKRNAIHVKQAKRPFHGGDKCYACDAKPIGLADRTHSPEHGFMLACRRHRDPTIKTYDACIFCNGPVRKGSVVIDGEFAHKSCYTEQTRG